MFTLRPHIAKAGLIKRHEHIAAVSEAKMKPRDPVCFSLIAYVDHLFLRCKPWSHKDVTSEQNDVSLPVLFTTLGRMHPMFERP